MSSPVLPGTGGSRAAAIPPPLVLVVLVAAETALSMLFPTPRVGPGPSSVLGIALLLGGIWLHLEADRVFRAAGTTRAPRGLPRRLVTHGVYRLSRNPMYLGGALFLGGLALALGPAVTFVVPALYVALVGRLYVVPEEAVLRERFGEEYRSYRERVRRWI